MRHKNTTPAQNEAAGQLDKSSLPVNRVSEGSSNRTVVRTGAIKKIILGSIAILGIGLVAAKHVGISQDNSKLAVVADVTLENVEALGWCELLVNGTTIATCSGDGNCKEAFTNGYIIISIVCSGTYQQPQPPPQQ